MNSDRQRIAEALQPLIGRTLFAANRAANMESFQFGTPGLMPSALPGRSRVVGEYALHVQCEWKLLGARGDVIASSSSEHTLAPWLKANAIKVVSVSAEPNGAVTINLTRGYSLRVVVDENEGEQWRLLQPGRDSPHFVLRDSGIE